MSILSERLRELRGKESQVSFAAAIGLKYQQYQQYESGKNVPGAEILATICKVHACSADWLLGIEKSPISNPTHDKDGENWRCNNCPYKRKIKAVKKLLNDI